MLTPNFPVAIVLLSFSLFSFTYGQVVKCNTVAGGCSDGKIHDSVVKAAISRFLDNTVYGSVSSAPVVFSSSNSGGVSIASVSYSCTDGSIPPAIAGSSIKSYLSRVVSCPNQCGSVSLPQNSKCGLGVLVVGNPAGTSCFSRALNVVPTGSSSSVVPSFDSFKNPKCYVDGSTPQILTDGKSSNSRMTVEDCVGLANGWRFAGIKPEGNCFWGDAITSSAQVNLAECTTPCPNDARQACGASNRMLVYEDENFVVPILQDIINIVEGYTTRLEQLRAAVAKFNNLLVEYLDGGGADVPLKRDLAVRIPPLQLLLTAFAEIQAMEVSWSTFLVVFDNLIQAGYRYGRILTDVIEIGRFSGLTNDVRIIFNQIRALPGQALATVRGTITITINLIGVGGGFGVGFFVGLLGLGWEILSLLRPPSPGEPIPPPLPRLEVCELDTCSGGTCRDLRVLVRWSLEKRVQARTPDDIPQRPGPNTDMILYAPDFPTNLTWDLVWWECIKYLLWWQGSHHGVSQFPPYDVTPSSAFVPWEPNPNQNVVTGAGPVYGCTTVAVVTNRGAYTAHFWEIPYFDRPHTNPGFIVPVINFLWDGLHEENYLGLWELTQPGQPFEPSQRDFMYVGIMTPEHVMNVDGRWVGTGLPRYPRHLDLIQRAVATILGVPRGTFDTRVYAHDLEIFRTPLNPDPTHRRPYRKIRVVDQQYRGYLIIERRRIDTGLRRAVRVHVENVQAFFLQW